MDEEERALEPAVRAALSDTEIDEFGRRCVERTALIDQRMMLGWMLPAMTRDSVEALLRQLPPTVAVQLRGLVATADDGDCLRFSARAVPRANRWMTIRRKTRGSGPGRQGGPA